MPYDGIHHHAEKFWVKRLSLGEFTQTSEGGAVVLTHLFHHKEVVPLEAEDSLHPRSDAISYQDIHSLLPVQGIVGFSEVQEDLIEALLPHHCYLVDQLDFKVGGSCSSNCPEPVERVMEVHHCPYLTIHHS